MNFTSKGNTLKNLKLKHATVPTFLIFKVKDFKKNKKKIINQIIQKFITKKLIVRSSFIGEDSNQTSMAGKYLSIGNLNCNKDVIKNLAHKNYHFFSNNFKETVNTYYRPTYITFYYREAFVSKIFPHCRITFDKNIRCFKYNFDIFGNPNIDRKYILRP